MLGLGPIAPFLYETLSIFYLQIVSKRLGTAQVVVYNAVTPTERLIQGAQEEKA